MKPLWGFQTESDLLIMNFTLVKFQPNRHVRINNLSLDGCSRSRSKVSYYKETLKNFIELSMIGNFAIESRTVQNRVLFGRRLASRTGSLLGSNTRCAEVNFDLKSVFY